MREVKKFLFNSVMSFMFSGITEHNAQQVYDYLKNLSFEQLKRSPDSSELGELYDVYVHEEYSEYKTSHVLGTVDKQVDTLYSGLSQILNKV